ncbi:MAG: MFS transporter [Phycisphaerae bacterium]|jgi:dipeptide/tripeptide permease
MPDGFVHPEEKLSWRFPKAFWIANTCELFERAAFYGMFIALAMYLTEKVGFTDVETGYVSACFASIIYLLPTFMGAMADKIGFKAALTIAFSLLTVGYFLLGAAPEAGRFVSSPLAVKGTAVLSLATIMFGGAIIKPVISGTVAKCSDDQHRARAFSIFYQVVNIGAFTGKTVAYPLRDSPRFGLEYINYYAALMAFCALITTVLFYKNVDTKGTAKTAREAWDGLVKVVLHFRFMALILIVAGFWTIQGQLYATVPKYYLRLLGEGKPEWLANINPFVVVICVVPVTHLIRRFRPENAIGIGLFIIPLTALCIAASPLLESATGRSVNLLGLSLHPITVMVMIGIGMQGLAECFLSPKFLEYASKQAPEGEIGLYLGYQHLTTFFAWAFGFAASGHLLDRFCPRPETLPLDVQQERLDALATGTALPEAYAHAHYIWIFFAGVGIAAFLGLLLFKFVTTWIDRKRTWQEGVRAAGFGDDTHKGR